ncbi:thiamine-phosphate synthase family protein [Haloarcula salina]|uniref:thiamine-phosphate synthase family protein n=1 Tax=Haloarcula salina TaxID=1429914 RepID=UPI003C6FD85B
MTLQLPSEIVVERFLPTARAMLAAELDAEGWTQQEIADQLGVTQAAVSKYKSGDVSVEDRFREDPRMRQTIERIAAGLAADEMDEYEVLDELLALVAEFEDRGPICAVHEEEMPALQGMGCDLCVRGTDAAVLEERTVLSSVRRATRLLSDAAVVVAAIPNVGMNVGMALPDADDALDVAAVPGRIHDLRGRVNVPSNPEFGASEHVAGTILAAMAVDPTRRAALNVVTDEAVLDSARERGVEPLQFDAGYEDRADRLEAAFRERGAVPRVIYHEGAFGVEPITYVFGETAVDAAEFAVELLADAAE